MATSRTVRRLVRVRAAALSRWLAALCLPAALLVGCSDPTTAPGSLDAELIDALAEASEGEGLAFFTMPASSDLSAIPQDPSNPLTREKVALGQLLYHDSGLMTTPKRAEGIGTASCASCHHARAGFQAGRRQGIGEGGTGFGKNGLNRTAHSDWPDDGTLDVQPIRTPTAMNGAYQDVMLWNGQFGGRGTNAGTEAHWTPGTPKETNHLGYEGLETQAIAGLTVHRMGDVVNSVAGEDPTYISLFEAAFPDDPTDQERAGLAIAAYERTLLATEAPFQRWLRGRLSAMSTQEKRGALLFFGKAQCAACHTGPALNSMTFHALGMGDLQGTGVFGPTGGEEVLGRGGFTQREEEMYAFKTPQLYNLKDSPFMGHGGTFNSVREVVEYKNRAVPENRAVPADRLADGLKSLNLSSSEVDDIVAFVEQALYDADLNRYVPKAVPSGSCIPVNDGAARADLGCDRE